MSKKKTIASKLELPEGQRHLFDLKLRQAAVAEFERGNFKPVEELCSAVLKIAPHDPFAYTGLGNLELKRGNFMMALDYFQRGLEVAPNDAAMHANISSVYSDLRKLSEAYRHAKRATELAPDNYVAWLNLGNACNRLQKYAESEVVSRRALEIDPAGKGAINNLANALKEMGRVHEAVELYLKALTDTPDFYQGYINLLLALLYHPDAKVADIAQVAKAFGHRMESSSKPWSDHANAPEPWRKLRVGFLSPDFRSHSVMYFAEPLMARLDRNQFEVIAYFLLAGEDTVTARTRRICDDFYNLAGLEPKAQAEKIRADGVDILIDLAGHTGNSGLLAMAFHPAPVQVTWLGYPGTTGMSTIDWRITDSTCDPPGSEEFYTEKLIRLPPPFCVYRPCIRSPLERYAPSYQVKTAPAMRNGFVTFGCCNNVGKLTPRTLRLWAALLERLPTARLLIEAKGLHDKNVEAELRNRLVEHGLPSDRLILVAQETRNQYLTYHFIDIALDPFPLNGGTTSFDVLWMGIPLVVMAGDTFRSRMGMTILESCGHSEWIATDEASYLTIAEQLAHDIPALNEMRLQQRGLVEKSPLMDEVRFASLFGEALRQAWLNWCAERLTGMESAGKDAMITGWNVERPELLPAQEKVFLAPGEQLDLQDAITRLHDPDIASSEKRTLAIRTLESIPNVPEALVALAEVERTGGNAELATHYLSHALDFLGNPLTQALRLVEWLLLDGQREQAWNVLQWLAGRYPQMAGELQQTAASLRTAN